ncbi:hypothetical protein KIL84_013491, partial [Mauremys mutica]
SEFDDFLKAAGSKLVVVDFSAKWCGPCKAIDPVIHDLAVRYDNVMFCSVDIDLAEDVANSCKIIAMPTFQMYKKTEKEPVFGRGDLGVITGSLWVTCRECMVQFWDSSTLRAKFVTKDYPRELYHRIPQHTSSYWEIDADSSRLPDNPQLHGRDPSSGRSCSQGGPWQEGPQLGPYCQEGWLQPPSMAEFIILLPRWHKKSTIPGRTVYEHYHHSDKIQGYPFQSQEERRKKEHSCNASFQYKRAEYRTHPSGTSKITFQAQGSTLSFILSELACLLL